MGSPYLQPFWSIFFSTLFAGNPEDRLMIERERWSYLSVDDQFLLGDMHAMEWDVDIPADIWDHADLDPRTQTHPRNKKKEDSWISRRCTISYIMNVLKATVSPSSRTGYHRSLLLTWETLFWRLVDFAAEEEHRAATNTPARQRPLGHLSVDWHGASTITFYMQEDLWSHWIGSMNINEWKLRMQHILSLMGILGHSHLYEARTKLVR